MQKNLKVIIPIEWSSEIHIERTDHNTRNSLSYTFCEHWRGFFNVPWVICEGKDDNNNKIVSFEMRQKVEQSFHDLTLK